MAFSKAAIGRQFLSDLKAALRAVEERCIYRDSVGLLLHSRPSRRCWSEVERLNGGHAFLVRRKASGDYPWRALIHQPTKAVVENLRAELAPGYLVNRVDVSADLIVQSQHETTALGDMLNMSITQLWHGKRKSCAYKGIHYYAQASRGRNIVIYSDNPSKVGGRPCVHIEIRLYGAEACRRYGVSDFGEFLNFDPIEVFRRNIRFSLLDKPALESVLDDIVGRTLLRHNRHRRHAPLNRVTMRDRVNAWLCHCLRDDDWKPTADTMFDLPAQAWIDRAPDFPRPVLIHLPSDLLFEGGLRGLAEATLL